MKDAQNGGRLSDQCSRCHRLAYAHGLCHRCWCREGLELDTPRRPLTTPQVAPYFAASVPWGGSQGNRVSDYGRDET